GEFDDPAYPGTVDDALAAGGDLQRYLRCRQAGQHCFGAVGHVRGGGRGHGAERDRPVHRLGAGVEHHEPVAGFPKARGHLESHIAQADQADIRGVHPALSSSAKTSRAIRKPSTPAGTPAYTATCRSTSRISSRVTPLLSAPLTWVRNSCGRLSTESIARVSIDRICGGRP